MIWRYMRLGVLLISGIKIVGIAYQYRPVQDILPIPKTMNDALHAISVVPDLSAQSHSATALKPDIMLSPFPLNDQYPITQVKVYKYKRYMDLMSGEQVIRRYVIRLGFSPEGHKRQEGDGKTPEGKYVLDWRNSKSQYYKSFHVSYPNEQDKKRAAQRGVEPGGEIMIHGSPNKINLGRELLKHYLPNHDWTFGCIAVSNAVMDEMWESIIDGTPIIIYP